MGSFLMTIMSKPDVVVVVGFELGAHVTHAFQVALFMQIRIPGWLSRLFPPR
jgi:hypothetical protein